MTLTERVMIRHVHVDECLYDHKQNTYRRICAETIVVSTLAANLFVLTKALICHCIGETADVESA
jgi:hypothetical protein